MSVGARTLAPVPLILLCADHRQLDLADVERLSSGADDLPALLQQEPTINGAVVVATCNRLEIALDTDEPIRAVRAAYQAVARSSGVHAAEVAELLNAAEGDEVALHLYEMTSGLASMVVGEREITGQVRRALRTAEAAGQLTAVLHRVFQGALKTARRVLVETDLHRAGRSVISVGLDLAAQVRAGHGCPRHAGQLWTAEDAVPEHQWGGARCLLVGTGAYAGTTLRALQQRGVTEVEVWSASGRAAGFVESHQGVGPQLSVADDLAAALRRADVVVCCRGTGTPALTADILAPALSERTAVGPLVVVDMALSRDVDADAAALPGVIMVDLATVRRHAPAATLGEVERAQQVVQEGIDELQAIRAERSMDPVVVALRSQAARLLEGELARLPMAGEVSAEDAAHALRRLTAALLHEPTVLARAAGREGRGEDFAAALSMVTGLDSELATPREVAWGLDWEQVERERAGGERTGGN
ncbi:glutamyl-tRNA reductase [Parenemella sanctibonifatiensis]|uniref:Glutamyl-tRNA reductase n=1 Tax=Parenemella sanctibonifatiensis TaxID=2016505 RepID=A0A255ECU5_9ACTN|nr:glutamyl-tRNA reductase [Parenemella sanctibonifatiensis]